MARPIAEYSLHDWSRLRPVTQAYKSLRYRLINEGYVRRRERAGDAVSLAASLRGRNVLVTVAFDDPQATAWQTALVAAYVPDALHIVADNSLDDRNAARIAAIAARRRAAYVRLPAIRWRRGTSSRSHGLALNWIWRNILRPGQPAAFGFLDDDIFPTAPDDPFAPLASQDFFGVVRNAGPRWFLWAGFCFFRFDRVRRLSLDFGQDWFNGLDTGGGNWRVLYRHVDLGTFRHAPNGFFPYRAGVSLADGPMQRVGVWLHEVGGAPTAEIAADKRRVLAEMLAPHLAAAGTGLPPPGGDALTGAGGR